MGKFTVTHEIHCDVDTFWKTFLDKEFNTKLYVDALGFPEFKVVDQFEDDTRASRKVSAQPKMEVPAAVQKLFGSGFRYTEEGSMTKPERVWRWKMTPSTMADKLFTGGLIRVERIDDNRSRRIAEMSIEAKIFGVGGLIESSAEKQLRDGWDKSAVYMNKYLQSLAK
ncbi:Hypothetical protein A7982_03692 [Minicystis rosea]|nr:Hypothetical protein A7982_03692 [Minicystis rosea]